MVLSGCLDQKCLWSYYEQLLAFGEAMKEDTTWSSTFPLAWRLPFPSYLPCRPPLRPAPPRLLDPVGLPGE